MPSNIKIEIRAELRDRKGKLIKRFPWRPCRSLLKQFIQNLMYGLSQEVQTVTDIAGTGRAHTTITNLLASNAGAGITTYGILIGTGTTAVTITDYKLETPVTANIAHAIMVFAVENPDTLTWRIALSRVLTNNTGASLGIREVAIYCKIAGTAYFSCIDHSLYSVDVPNGVGVTLTYRITVSL